MSGGCEGVKGRQTEVFKGLEVVVVALQVLEVLLPLVKAVSKTRQLVLFPCSQTSATHILDVLFLIATSFCTPKLSNTCGRNCAFLTVVPQLGQGSGPKEKILSIQLSHLRKSAPPTTRR